MKVGITYDLRDDYAGFGYGDEDLAEFDCAGTIDAIDNAIRSLGHTTDRIGNASSLAHRLIKGSRWDIVFNIAEGRHGFGREALVPALLDSYQIPYTFSDPLALSITLHKGMAKRIVRDMGVSTPDFRIVEQPADLDGIELPFPLFIKPIAEGSSKGISGRSKVRDPSELRCRCEYLLERFHQPLLVEKFLPGREFCVGVLGTGHASYTLGVLEIILKSEAEPEVYSFTNKKDCLRLVRYELVDDLVKTEASQIALDVWRGLGCRDGGRVELRCDAGGCLNFIEANPLTGLQADSDLVTLAHLKGVSFVELIGQIVASACRRVGAERRASKLA